jgi:signal transduction histidine kinase
MQAMIKDILAYSRAVDAANQESAAPRASAIQALDKALENLSPAISECKAAISWGLLPRVAVAENHLVQIFQNLIGNALKYRGAEQPRVHIDATMQNGRCLFSVTDNGIGIPAEYRERVFGLFKRLHDGSVPGTGIGLPLCRRIVTYYGGRIWIESAESPGTTFWFTLPAESEAYGSWRSVDAMSMNN